MRQLFTFLATATVTLYGICAEPAEPVKSETNPLELAQRFSGGKLWNMLFSTTVDPHWFQSGEKFWYSYKTSDGTKWYIVDPVRRSKTLLFDNDKMASELTTIVKDPMNAAALPIANLEVQPDGYTFTFDVKSSQDAKPKKDADGKEKKPENGEKETFYFSYDSRNGKLTHLEGKEKETKELHWASVSPDGKTVVYAKDFNLYRMSREDYEKLKKNENDSTITEIQITTDGEKDFGYGQGYSYLNTDTLANGKRKGTYVLFSPDSRYFVANVTDERPVKELWVINSLASPRPTLETYKYQMPGESEAPEEHLYLFDLSDNSRKEIKTNRFKNQTLSVGYRPRQHKQRSMHDVPNIWLGDDKTFYVTRSSRDLHRIDICSYTIGQDSIVPVIEERMNTYQEVRPLALVGDKPDEVIQWSERDGWAHLYLYDGKGNMKRRLTEGPWHVHNILNVDPVSRKVYFTAMGRDKDENPYYQHLYSVGLDGGGVRLLDKGDYFHAPVVDDAGKYFVDNFSRVDTVPETWLYDTSGNKILSLERSDFSQLFANGYKFPETYPLHLHSVPSSVHPAFSYTANS